MSPTDDAADVDAVRWTYKQAHQRWGRGHPGSEAARCVDSQFFAQSARSAEVHGMAMIESYATCGQYSVPLTLGDSPDTTAVVLVPNGDDAKPYLTTLGEARTALGVDCTADMEYPEGTYMTMSAMNAFNMINDAAYAPDRCEAA